MTQIYFSILIHIEECTFTNIFNRTWYFWRTLYIATNSKTVFTNTYYFYRNCLPIICCCDFFWYCIITPI